MLARHPNDPGDRVEEDPGSQRGGAAGRKNLPRHSVLCLPGNQENVGLTQQRLLALGGLRQIVPKRQYVFNALPEAVSDFPSLRDAQLRYRCIDVFLVHREPLAKVGYRRGVRRQRLLVCLHVFSANV
ncbi:hypothetical protein BN2475_860020 [Paraburkholderia ribeironis]|uniref:Uncharacterized protein n=1 Tax=Paraburkholderia ribeironis TaxID=1247936 RepID=A0A1N7SKV1_9BURK|nr:hypothetical protein BN2475_860020 [Paraburkholderia ribeironis]